MRNQNEACAGPQQKLELNLFLQVGSQRENLVGGVGGRGVVRGGCFRI